MLPIIPIQKINFKSGQLICHFSPFITEYPIKNTSEIKYSNQTNWMGCTSSTTIFTTTNIAPQIIAAMLNSMDPRTLLDFMSNISFRFDFI
ncbi:hypothetical protein FD31_GL000434 [Companilactobacillus nantensis DSM 16982]|uniref:Uncharacterized protein n=1 Tax=Companilactobacillus nantensis DSM 16982 TaxID=1423774 RepID=A0A0R1WIB9_9LACO|nr:hypothetical protein FD31_GL000434 [Companilactobacillus nantensis DSM 16982]